MVKKKFQPSRLVKKKFQPRRLVSQAWACAWVLLQKFSEFEPSLLSSTWLEITVLSSSSSILSYMVTPTSRVRTWFFSSTRAWAQLEIEFFRSEPIRFCLSSDRIVCSPIDNIITSTKDGARKFYGRGPTKKKNFGSLEFFIKKVFWARAEFEQDFSARLELELSSRSSFTRASRSDFA